MATSEQALKAVIDLKEEAIRNGYPLRWGNTISLTDNRYLSVRHVYDSALSSHLLAHLIVGLEESGGGSTVQIIHQPALPENTNVGRITFALSGATICDGVLVDIGFSQTGKVSYLFASIPERLRQYSDYSAERNALIARPMTEHIADTMAAVDLGYRAFNLR